MTSSSRRDSNRLVNDFFRKSPVLADALPAYLDDGVIVDQLECSCFRCRKPLDDVRGEILPSRSGLRVTAFGMCYQCELITPFMIDVFSEKGRLKIRHRKWEGWTAGEVVSLQK